MDKRLVSCLHSRPIPKISLVKGIMPHKATAKHGRALPGETKVEIGWSASPSHAQP